MKQLISVLQGITLGATGKHTCEGEFDSLKAIHAVPPGFVPQPYAWGKFAQDDPEIYFLLTEFRDVGKQVHAKDLYPKLFSFASHLAHGIRLSFRVTVSRLTTKAGKSYKARGWLGQST